MEIFTASVFTTRVKDIWNGLLKLLGQWELSPTGTGLAEQRKRKLSLSHKSDAALKTVELQKPEQQTT